MRSSWICLTVFLCPILGVNSGALAQPGTLDYAAILGGTGDANSYTIEVDDSGNVLLAGRFGGGAVDFDPGPGVTQFVPTTDTIGTEGEFTQSFIARYDDAGALVFARAITGYGHVRAIGAVTARNGDLLVNGTFETFPAEPGEELDFDPGPSVYHVASPGADSMFLLRLNPSGNFVSVQTWTTSGAQGIGVYEDFVLDPEGGIYLTGSYELGATFDADPGPGVQMLPVAQESDGFLIKLDPDGAFEYAYTVNGVYDQFVDLARIHPNGNVYLLGQFAGTVDFDPGAGVANLAAAPDNANSSIYLVRLDAAGNFVDANFLAEAQPGGDAYPLGADFDVIGNFYVCGALQGDADFDPSVGVSILSGAPADRSGFVVKLDNSGTLNYGHVFGASSHCRFWDLDATPEGTVYVVGDYRDTVDFDPGAGVANLTSVGVPGSRDGVVLRLNPDGSYNYAFSMESVDTTRLTYVDLDARQQLRFGGHFSTSADADPNAVGGYPITATGSRDHVLIKLNPEPVPPAPNGPRVVRVAPVSYFNLVYPVFEVEFSEEVIGVAPTDFIVSGSAGATIAVVTPLAANPETYQVAVSLTPTDGEYVRLAVVDDDSIQSTGTGQPLGGAGANNGNFNEGRGILIKSQGVDDDGGNVEYGFTFGNVVDTDEPRDIVTDYLGNTFVTGVFGGTVDFDPGPGTANLTAAGAQDTFVARYDPSGQLVFVRQLGGANDVEAMAVGIDSYGNDLYVAGHFQGTADFNPGPGTALRTATGQQDLFVARLDQDGNFVAAHTMGGTAQEWSVGMHVTSRGNFVLAGHYNSTDFDIDPGPGVSAMPVAQDYDMFLAGFFDDGSLAYAHHFGGTGADRLSNMTTDRGARLYLVGSHQGAFDADPGPGVVTIPGTGAQESFVLRMGLEGDYQASALLRDAGGATIYAQDIALDVQRDVSVCGIFGGTADFDPDPVNTNLVTAVGGDPFVVKLDRDLNFIWARTFETTGAPSANVRTNAIVSDRFGAVLVAGYFDTALDFDPGVGVNTLAPAGTHDGFLVRLNTDGTLGFAHQLGATNVGAYNNLYMDLRALDVYALGLLDGTIDVSANPATFALTDPASYDGFIAKLHFEHPTYYLHVPYVYDMVETNSKTVGTVTIEVTFTEDVTGVDSSDFILEGSGAGTIIDVTGSGNTYVVSISYDDESGPLALALTDDDSIVGLFTGEPLGGVGLGNGSFGDGPLPVLPKSGSGMPLASPLGLVALVLLLALAGACLSTARHTRVK